MHKFPLALIALAWFAAAPVRASDSAWVLKSGASYWELQTGLGRFTDGALPTTQLPFLFHTELGILENTTIVLEAPFLIRDQTRSGQTPAHLVNNGLTDLSLATRIQFFAEPFSLVLEPSVRVPTGYDPGLLPLIGDHTLDLGLGLNAGYRFDPLQAYVQGGLGYRFRGNFDKASAIALQARAQGLTYTKPTDQIFGFVETGVWILPQIFASLGLQGDFALTQADTWAESQLRLRPLLAWRLTPAADVSLQLDQVLWSQHLPALTQVLLGAHFRLGEPLALGTGLRGGISDYATRDDQLE